ncbi:MAG TPA: ester cyclase [Solirubrobacteraceae bacterium]|nr:ester cyclase [Solirubrobacteraceae bacterium]
MAGSGTDLAQAATDLIEAFNQADWERFRGLLASGAVYTETGTGRRVEGAGAYLQLVQGWKEAFPDVTGTIRHKVVSGDTAAQEILWEGTHTRPMQTPAGTLEPTGQRISVEASVWMRFEEGLVREVHHYLDVLVVLQQIGAIPTEAAA